jgi:hypothetical protein
MQDPKKYAYYELAHKILAVFKRINASLRDATRSLLPRRGKPSRRVGSPREAQRYAEDF